MKRKAIFIPLLVLPIAGWILWKNTGRASAAQYQTAVVERGNLNSFVAATGSLNAVVTVQVGSQVSGNIKGIYADFNSRVNKGQVVAQIDPQVFEARVAQARANQDSARSAVANAEASAKKAASDVLNAKAQVAQQEAQLAKAKAETRDAQIKLQRRKELFEEKILSREDWDTAQTTYDSALAAEKAIEANIAAAEAAVQAAEAQHQVALTQVEDAKAQVRQSSAALQQAEVDLEHTRIVAPVDGVVIARQMDVGQTVAASFQAPTIFQIAQDLTKMQVETNVDEADVGRIALGQPASFTVDAYPGTVFHGTVQQIRKAPVNTANVITYVVVVAVPNPDLKLFPGMTASVRIQTGQQEDTLKVPNAALRFRLANVPANGGQTVWVLDEQDRPEARQITAGLTDGQYTSIVGEVQEGDRVIVAGAVKTATARVSAPRRGPSF